MNRRSFLSNLFYGVSSFGLSGSIISQSNGKSLAKVVILGGGWGGLSAAKTIKLLSPEIEVIVVEKENMFRSCPISNWVIGQIKSMEDITFKYDRLKDVYGIKFINEEVLEINIDKKSLITTNYNINYDKLILSPGVELDYSSIDNWNASFLNTFPAAWKAGKETELLADKIKNMSNGGVISVSIPLSPYRCPPGPYERISLIASYIKKYKPASKIIVLDANQKIVSKGKLFKKAWDQMYSDIIEYRSDSRVVEVNPKEGILSTHFDDIICDVANLIPPQKAPKLLDNSGLIKKNESWASVNPYDFKSTLAKDVFIIGDSTSQISVGKVPKSGYIANSMGKVCGLAVICEIFDKVKLSPSMINTCYSLISSEEGISVSAVYSYNEDLQKIVSIEGASGLSPESSSIIKDNAWDWAQSIWADMLS